MLGFAAVDWFKDLFDSLNSYSNSPWLPLLVFVFAFADSLIPIVPSETIVIIGGVAAGQGDQQLAVVMAAAFAGAFLGDNAAYQLGSSASGFLTRTLFRGPGGAKRLETAAKHIRKRGGMLLVTARFIPGGRTAVTVSSGITRQPRRWFSSWVTLAAAIWAVYASLLGYIGGRTFQDNHAKAFLFAFVVAISATGLIELVRWLRHRQDPPGSGEVGTSSTEAKADG